MKLQRENSEGVGSSRLGGISSSVRTHGKDGQLPLPDECWMIRDTTHVQNEMSLMFPEIPNE